MFLFQCFGQKDRTSKYMGRLSDRDLRKMLDIAKRNNELLKQQIRRLDEEMEKLAIEDSGRKRFSGWIQFMKNDQPREWLSAWALLEKGRLQLFRDESVRSMKLIDVDLKSHEWKLHYQNGAYSEESYAVSDYDLPNMIVLNVFDQCSNNKYHLYINTGSEELKDAWCRALELEIYSD